MHRSVCKLTLATILSATALLTATSSQAETYPFSCIPDPSSSMGDCNIASQQIAMDVSSINGGQVAFTFYNEGGDASAIEGVYFDDGTLLGISYLIDKDENGGLNGVDFTAGSAAPPNLPRGSHLFPEFEVTAGFLADADPAPSKNGINPGEWLTIVFDLQGDGTYEDVIEELGDGRLRVGLHVIAFESGGAESLINNMSPIPLPPSLLLMISGLAGLAGIRFRRT